jgi:hypothetical protein
VTKIKWICCLQQSQQFIGKQTDIFKESNSIFYDEYYESLTGIETCSKCGATYAYYMVVEFTFPRIYFHIPISADNYIRFSEMEELFKEDLQEAKVNHTVLVEREQGSLSVWEWREITEDMWLGM